MQSSVLKPRPRNFDFLIDAEMQNLVKQLEFNFDEFKSRGMHEKYSSETWNVGTIWVFAQKWGEKIKTFIETLCVPYRTLR